MSEDEPTGVGPSRRAFLGGVVGAVAGALVPGCGLLTSKVGPIEIGHPSWHDDARRRADPHNPIRLRVASYNVHHWRGQDGKKDARRIAKVLKAIDADVVALQETDMGKTLDTDEVRLELVADALGHQVVSIPNGHAPGYRYRRNAILTRLPVHAVRCLDLSLEGRDPRGLIDVELALDGELVRVIGTHLGLDADERASQITGLLNWLYAHPKRRGVVVMGDFNEWFGPSSNLDVLERFLGEARGPSTFPADAPMLHLDRIWTNPVDGLKKVRVPKTRLTALASDHLPIWADVEL